MIEFTRLHRGTWGLLGGSAAVVSKFIAQDLHFVRISIDTRQTEQLYGMMASYALLTIGLSFLGIVLAIASRENSEMKLLAIAVSAPALITTWLGGAIPDTQKHAALFLWPITSAEAAEQTAKQSSASAFWEGFKIPFGIGKDEQRYRVIIGSFKDPAIAAAKADQVNKIDPSLKASVGDKRMFNDYYPVVVGGYAVYPEARALKDKVADKLGIDDVYLAPYQF
jgi:SPOR domain